MATTIAAIFTTFPVERWDVRGSVEKNLTLTSFAGGLLGRCIQLTVGVSYVPLTYSEVETLRDVCTMWLSGAPSDAIERRYNPDGHG